MTESKQKAVELVKKFTTLEDAIKCVEEIIKSSPHSPSKPLELMPHFKACKFWQEVLTHLKEML